MLICGLCGTAYEQEDNFCRHCGAPVQDAAQLPSVRDNPLPAVRQPSLPANVAKGAVVVAAGTLAEILARRLVRSLLDRRPRRSKKPAQPAPEKTASDPLADQTLLSETLLLRRIRIRR